MDSSKKLILSCMLMFNAVSWCMITSRLTRPLTQIGSRSGAPSLSSTNIGLRTVTPGIRGQYRTFSSSVVSGEQSLPPQSSISTQPMSFSAATMQGQLGKSYDWQTGGQRRTFSSEQPKSSTMLEKANAITEGIVTGISLGFAGVVIGGLVVFVVGDWWVEKQFDHAAMTVLEDIKQFDQEVDAFIAEHYKIQYNGSLADKLEFLINELELGLSDQLLSDAKQGGVKESLRGFVHYLETSRPAEAIRGAGRYVGGKPSVATLETFMRSPLFAEGFASVLLGAAMMAYMSTVHSSALSDEQMQYLKKYKTFLENKAFKGAFFDVKTGQERKDKLLRIVGAKRLEKAVNEKIIGAVKNPLLRKVVKRNIDLD